MINRILTIVIASIIVFGGWTYLKAKVLVPAARQSAPAAAAPEPSEKILWTAKPGEVQGGGDDPREVFSFGLNRYLGEQVSGASALALDRIDPSVVSQADDSAHLIATIRGVQYHGKLRWTDTGWQLIEISRAQ